MPHPRILKRLSSHAGSTIGGVRGDALIKRLLKNAGLLLGGKAAGAVMTLGFLALAERGLGLAGFGTLILIHSFVQLVGNVVKFQSWHAILTYGTPAWSEGRLRDLRKIIGFTARLDVCGTCAGFAIAVLCADLIGGVFEWDADVVRLAEAYAVSILFMATATPIGVLRLFDRFDLLALHASLAPLVQFVGAAIAYSLDAPLEAYLIVWFLATAASGTVLAGIGLLELRRKELLTRTPKGHPATWRATREVWRFVWSTNFSNMLELTFSHLGTLIVGAVAGPSSAALYRVARQFAEAVTAPAKLLTPAIFPQIAVLLAEHHLSRLRSFMFRTALLAGSAATVLVGILALAGGWVLRTVVGEEFSAAYGVMVVLGGAAAIRLWTLPFEPMLIASGMAHKVLAIRSATTVVYLAALVTLTSLLGVVGAGFAVVIAYCLNAAGFVALALPELRETPPEADNT